MFNVLVDSTVQVVYLDVNLLAPKNLRESGGKIASNWLCKLCVARARLSDSKGGFLSPGGIPVQTSINLLATVCNVVLVLN
jgi:hypothetical protein